MQAATMNDTSTMSTQQPAAKQESREIETRFGKVSINTAKAIHFAKGILGMPEKTRFCLTEFPIKRLPKFKLLQCADDDELAFVTLPIDLTNEFIKDEDLRDACRQQEMSPTQVAMLLIVSVHRRMDKVNLSVNARAPLLIDTKTMTAVQHVLSSNDYAIRQPITFNHGMIKPS